MTYKPSGDSTERTDESRAADAAVALPTPRTDDGPTPITDAFIETLPNVIVSHDYEQTASSVRAFMIAWAGYARRLERDRAELLELDAAAREFVDFMLDSKEPIGPFRSRKDYPPQFERLLKAFIGQDPQA